MSPTIFKDIPLGNKNILICLEHSQLLIVFAVKHLTLKL